MDDATRAKIAATLKGRKPVWTGQPRTEAHRQALSEAAKRRDPTTRVRGESHPDWKGPDAGYMAKHNWVRRRLGKASRQMCERCGWHAAEWANVSGEHRRDLSDYVALCVGCHRKMDGYRTRQKRKG
jgi:hypothetical protein